MAHTPGRWVWETSWIEPDEYGEYGSHDEGRIIAVDASTGKETPILTAARDEYYLTGTADDIALICAAPVMLALLEDLSMALRFIDGMGPYLAQIDAVTRQARSEAREEGSDE
jgi:hypothetical protein